MELAALVVSTVIALSSASVPVGSSPFGPAFVAASSSEERDAGRPVPAARGARVDGRALFDGAGGAGEPFSVDLRLEGVSRGVHGADRHFEAFQPLHAEGPAQVVRFEGGRHGVGARVIVREPGVGTVSFGGHVERPEGPGQGPAWTLGASGPIGRRFGWALLRSGHREGAVERRTGAATLGFTPVTGRSMSATFLLGMRTASSREGMERSSAPPGLAVGAALQAAAGEVLSGVPFLRALEHVVVRAVRSGEAGEGVVFTTEAEAEFRFSDRVAGFVELAHRRVLRGVSEHEGFGVASGVLVRLR